MKQFIDIKKEYYNKKKIFKKYYFLLAHELFPEAPETKELIFDKVEAYEVGAEIVEDCIVGSEIVVIKLESNCHGASSSFVLDIKPPVLLVIEGL